MSQPKRSFFARRDGTRVAGSHDLNALFPYVMKRRCDSIVYFSEMIDVENLLAYIEKKKDGGEKVTFFQLFIVAIVKLMRERPHLNRFIRGRRLYQRNSLDVNFIAKRAFTDDAGETNVTIRVKPEDKFEDILQKLSGDIRAAKEGVETGDDEAVSVLMRLPRFVLMLVIRLCEFMDFFKGVPLILEKIDPLRCSAFVANLGSVGIEAPYHHLYEWGTASIFIAIGKIKKMPVVNDEGEIVARTMVEIKVALDERIADGFYCARSLDLFNKYLNDPACLESI